MFFVFSGHTYSDEKYDKTIRNATAIMTAICICLLSFSLKQQANGYPETSFFHTKKDPQEETKSTQTTINSSKYAWPPADLRNNFPTKDMENTLQRQGWKPHIALQNTAYTPSRPIIKTALLYVSESATSISHERGSEIREKAAPALHTKTAPRRSQKSTLTAICLVSWASLKNTTNFQN